MSHEQTSRSRKAKPWTETGLRAAALYYLERYASTEANLVRVLDRKIKRRLGEDSDPAVEEDLKAAARRIAADLVRLGILDDGGYAEARARRLQQQGRSLRIIRQDLMAKGVAGAEIKRALEALRDERGLDYRGLDLAAAIAFARKRRLGPYAREKEGIDPRAAKRRALGAFARAGFAHDLALRILRSDSVDELQRLLDETADV